MTTCTCNPTLIRPSASPWTCPHGNTWRLGVPGDPYCWSLEPRVTPEQAKANADAAFAVGALCGALGAVGREIVGTKIQRRFEQVVAAQDGEESRRGAAVSRGAIRCRSCSGYWTWSETPQETWKSPYEHTWASEKPALQYLSLHTCGRQHMEVERRA